MKYTITPVTDTYSHTGNVQRAMALCLVYCPVSAKYSVNRTKPTVTTAKLMCVSNKKKYTPRSAPVPPKCVLSTCE